MPAYSEYELLSDAVDFTLRHAQEVEAKVVKALQTNAATSHVNTLRMLTMQSTIVAIGALQAFEGLLQQEKSWKDTFKELDTQLRATGYADLADRFADYREAINALKHGHGRSYDKLEARRDDLPFRVKAKGEHFFNEGDVSEGIRLVDAGHEFVRQCSDMIQEIVQALHSSKSKQG